MAEADDFNAGIRIEVENDLFRNEDEEMMEEDPPSGDDDLLDEGETSPVVPEPMQNESDDKEDGELSGHEDNSAVSNQPTFTRKDSSGSLRGPEDIPYKARLYPNPHLEDLLVTPERLSSRAARFGTQISEAPKVYVQEPLPTDGEVLGLYTTLGLIDDDGGEPSLEKVGKQYRLDSILIRGTNEMSTNDIFGYLRDHNQRPLEMEWVNDACCIVRYKDLYEAARSVLKITKPIHYEPKPEKKEEPEEGEEVDDEDEDEAMDEVDYDAVDSVSSKYITVAIPPGHTWRFAAPCSQARGILMRYATVNDKKQEKAERHSEYYKKFGNPNYPGHGIVSTSFRRRQQERPKPAAPAEPLSNQASWAQISDSWNDEEEGIAPVPPNRQRPPQQQSNVSVHERLGRGRGGFSRGGGEPDQRIIFGRGQRGKNFRVQVEFDRPPPRSDVRSRLKRRHSPAGSESRRSRDSDDSDNDNNEDEDEEWTKKLKVPRMRMHADEEEEKMKEKKQRRAPQQSRPRVAERVSWIDARERIPRRRNRDGW